MVERAVRLDHPDTLVAHALSQDMEPSFILTANVGPRPHSSQVLERGAGQTVSGSGVASERYVWPRQIQEARWRGLLTKLTD